MPEPKLILLDHLVGTTKQWQRNTLDTVIADIISGQYNNPERVVAFNTAEGWARDVTEDVAREVMARAIKEDRSLSDAVRSFVGRATGDAMPERAI